MSKPTRRAVLSAALAVPASRMFAASDKVNLVIIGIGGRGRDHIQEFSKQPNCRIAGVCDVNQEARERGIALVEKLVGSKPTEYSDMRKVFDDKAVDAVSVATPNHWHALATIWGCQAGKDVYVEKPASHNVWEGQRMIEAADKYKRMVQVGSQGRSMEHKIKAVQLLRDAAIGKVYLAKGLCYKRRKSIGHTPEQPVPPGIDWDKFLGPAPMRPFTTNRYKYNWHWFWDTGNGDIGNQGVHEMDMARWGLNKEGLPNSVVSTGGKFAYDDDQETPNTQIATFDYGDSQLVFEVRGLITNPEQGITIGDIFYGTDGFMTVDDRGYQVFRGEKKEKVLEGVMQGDPDLDAGPHMANFLNAVKTRDKKHLTAAVDIGVKSAALCHLANISYRLNRELKFDPAKWTFVGDSEANGMLTRKYRPPYVVPAKV
jgi:predicted dehydrogenase